jgi:3-oxoacyl-[acyl-carrier protein] reductase
MGCSRLSDKVALITGAGRGIGSAIAIRFSDEGAKVVINDVESAFAQGVARRLQGKGRPCLAVHGDISDRAEVVMMFEQAEEAFGGVDILVNNAGIRLDEPFPEMSEKTWDKVFSVQLKGGFNCAQTAQKYMIRRGYGRIINIGASLYSALGWRGKVNYASAGAGVEGFTRSLALELGAYNITVNCIIPEYIDTEMTRQAARREGLYLNDLKRYVEAEIPLKRLGTPLEVANAALFLASDESSFITGQVIHVRGGP